MYIVIEDFGEPNLNMSPEIIKIIGFISDNFDVSITSFNDPKCGSRIIIADSDTLDDLDLYKTLCEHATN